MDQFAVAPYELPVADLLRLAPEAEALGYATLALGEAGGSDIAVLFGALAARTERIGLLSGILNVYTRTPAQLAMAATTLAELSGGRFALGLGLGGTAIIEGWHGVPFERPLLRLRETITALRTMLAGERTAFAGETVRSRGFRLRRPAQPIPIYLGALGPRALALGGELADGVILNWIPAEAVPGAVEQVQEGVRRGRREAADVQIITNVRIAVAEDEAAEDAVRERLRRELLFYLLAPVYDRFFRTLGFADECDAVTAAWRGGEREHAAEAISERMLRAMAVFGPAASCREQIAAFRAAGTDLPCLFVMPYGADPVGSVRATMAALAPASAR